MAMILLLAMAFDGLIGDPKWIYNRIAHPVTWMALLLMKGESVLNKNDRSRLAKQLLGPVWISLCVAICLYCAFFIQDFLSAYDQSGIILALLSSVFIAYRSLMDHVGNVEKALLDQDIKKARFEISKIVGRETANLDNDSITRATIESLAENFSDGVVAPVFWFIIGGFPGIVAYKMINTADSMIGNRSERFKDFGKASAKIDDVVNYIPARLTALLLLVTAGVLNTGTVKIGFLTANNYHGLHASPNAGWPEATMAGLLNIKLGGPRHYQNGNSKDNAWLGNGLDIKKSDLTKAMHLIKYSWVLVLCLVLLGSISWSI
ncbi:MAG: adenosylcobinamide-phosphate synthase CbiB [Emcibacteraceae bacterium]|nr:adenosylcobinamide-phosphate synthase CbiB [Emcibacteraceae bacterium]